MSLHRISDRGAITALRRAAGEIEGFQPAPLVSPGPGTPKRVMSLEQTYSMPPFSSASTPSRTTAGGAGLDELFRLPPGLAFTTPPSEAALIECAVLGGCHAFRKAFIRNADRCGLGKRQAARRTTRMSAIPVLPSARARRLLRNSLCKRISSGCFLIHD